MAQMMMTYISAVPHPNSSLTPFHRTGPAVLPAHPCAPCSTLVPTHLDHQAGQARHPAASKQSAVNNILLAIHITCTTHLLGHFDGADFIHEAAKSTC